MSRIDKGGGKELLLLFLLLRLLGSSLRAFLAFDFLLALLDDFGLRRRRTRDRRFDRFLFLDTERDDVRKHGVWIRYQTKLVLVEGQVASTQALVQHQAAHVNLELRRNVRGQALDFNFASHN